MTLSHFSEKHLVNKKALNVETHSCVIGAVISRLVKALLLCMPAMFLILLNTAVLAQYPPVPQVIIIDASKPNPEQQNYKFGDKFPEGAVTSIEVRGDGKKWRFIMFEKLQQGITLKVKGKPRGYENNQVLEQGLWYQFRDNLPLELSIDPKAISPLELLPKLGVVKSEELVRNFNSAEEVTAWANRNKELITPTSSSSIKLYWGITPPLPTPTPSVSPTPEASGNAAFFLSIVKSPIFIAVIIILLLAFLIKITNLRERFTKWYFSRGQNLSQGNAVKQNQQSSLQVKTPLATVSVIDGKVERSSTTTNPTPKIGAEDISGLEERIKALKVEMSGEISKSITSLRGELKTDLDTKWGHNDNNLYASIQPKVAYQIGLMKNEILKELETQRQYIDERLVTLNKKIDDLSRAHQEEQAGVQSRFEQVTNEHHKLFEILEAITQARQQMESRIQQAERSINEGANDLFYARMLALTLENRVDVLSENGFKNLIEKLEKRLNGFFHNEVTRETDGLQELAQRAEAIKVAFKRVVEQISELQTDGSNPRHLAEHAEVIAAEVSGLQPQLQSRQLEIKTTLRIPVSAHPGARRTFLEELAQGLMREIDKLSDPKNYFENELESLATSDIVNLTDICDQRFGRKEQSELEKSLQHLFEQAGLRDIVPKPEESFKTSEQELVEMVPGKPQDRLKIAEVLTRGFILKREGQDTLLRKAGVKVYR
ncbi:MAG TPA: nucleotide exchange factor GrpE [Pyrinomonadaceae bacterium]|jgi:hypothetical protein